MKPKYSSFYKIKTHAHNYSTQKKEFSYTYVSADSVHIVDYFLFLKRGNDIFCQDKVVYAIPTWDEVEEISEEEYDNGISQVDGDETSL